MCAFAARSGAIAGPIPPATSISASRTRVRTDAVIWKAPSRPGIKPQEGLEVIATGRITTFPGKSTYQIVVESLEPAGIGA